MEKARGAVAGARARIDGPASRMTGFARRVAGALGIPLRAIGEAPRVFASRIGDLDGALQKHAGMRALLERAGAERIALEPAAEPV